MIAERAWETGGETPMLVAQVFHEGRRAAVISVRESVERVCEELLREFEVQNPMTDRFARAKVAATNRGTIRTLRKALNLLDEGMLKEGMSEPAVFARFPSARQALEEGILSDTLAMIVDLSPFSEFVADSSATEIRDLLAYYYEETVPIIESGGGVVEKYIGDAIVALFGAPFTGASTTSENIHHAFTAARLATARIHAIFHGDLAAKTAICKGELFIGVVGPDSHSELTAVGNPLTVLFRLEEISRRNSLTITSELYEQIRGRFQDTTEPAAPGTSWRPEPEIVELRGVGRLRVTRCTFNL
ncbi:MAG: adenylate/guanylate cyclase domain-containing protein [Sandaracinaceae bacterium]|nr:adenylate/guanylate cyclase domain-containing protein [Sandaracinaceae bacterium]